jgi:hypothetical protein
MLNEEREKEEQRKKWQATMETRVEGWRDFKVMNIKNIIKFLLRFFF